ncbi:MAG: hypothetical protein ACJ71S_06580 [Acidobacteriaceae bacterium]|jgi:hypothetical protein
MAQHIDSIAGSEIEKVTRLEFYSRLQPGDLIFCQGRFRVSQVIEGATHSPFSHVLKAWLPGDWCTQWLTLEATIDRGVHVGLLSDYIDSYHGDIVIGRRGLKTTEMEREVNQGLSLVDDKYDWQQEVSVAARKLLKCLPLIEPRSELYCSGLQYVMSLASSQPLQRPAESYPTPEDNWTDPSVSAVCALLTK